MSTIEQLQTEAARALRAYSRDPEAPDKTELLRAAASSLVDLRGLFHTEEGRPDWRGQTYAYRLAIGEVYSRAGVSSDDHETISSAVRYHIGNILRERLTEGELKEIGLRPLSPRSRSVEKRERNAALLASLRGGGEPGSGPDPLRALAAGHGLILRVTPEDLAGMELAVREAAEILLDETASHIRQLRRR